MHRVSVEGGDDPQESFFSYGSPACALLFRGGMLRLSRKKHSAVRTVMRPAKAHTDISWAIGAANDHGFRKEGLTSTFNTSATRSGISRANRKNDSRVGTDFGEP